MDIFIDWQRNKFITKNTGYADLKITANRVHTGKSFTTYNQLLHLFCKNILVNINQ